MAKLSVDQALLKAKSHVKKGKIEEAQKLYQMVLKAFSRQPFILSAPTRNA